MELPKVPIRFTTVWVFASAPPLTHKKILQAGLGAGPRRGNREPSRVINQLRNTIEKNAARPSFVLTEPWWGTASNFQLWPPNDRPAATFDLYLKG